MEAGWLAKERLASCGRRAPAARVMVPLAILCTYLQLETYKASEETTKAFYLIVDVGKKDEKLLAKKNAASAAGAPGWSVAR